MIQDFHGGSDGKASAFNVGDPGSEIPRSGSSPGEGIGYPLQYSWAFLVAQMVKNLPAISRDLGSEDPLEEGMLKTTPVFWPGASPWAEEPGGLQSMGSQRIRHE